MFAVAWGGRLRASRGGRSYGASDMGHCDTFQLHGLLCFWTLTDGEVVHAHQARGLD